MIDLPDLPALTAALTDRRFAAALGVAALSGFVRGFSGFGSALIYIPLIAAIYEPRIAAPTLLLIDLAGSVPFTIRELQALQLARGRRRSPPPRRSRCRSARWR